MNLSQIKKKLEANLAKELNPLDAIAIDSPAVLEFMGAVMQKAGMGPDTITVSSPSKDSLQVAIAAPLAYPLDGGVGSLEVTQTLLTLTQGDDDALGAALDMAGSFQLGSGNRRLVVEGSLSDPESGVLALTVQAEGMPQLAELAAELGLVSVVDGLKSLGFSLPVLDRIQLGVTLATETVTQLTTAGSMTLGAGELEMTCQLVPEVTLEGGIKEGSQLALVDLLGAFPLDPATLPSSRLQTLRLVAQPSLKTSQVTFELVNDWTIDIGGTSLALASLSGQIDSALDTLAATFTGTVDVAGVSLLLTSDYSSQGDLSFTGAMAPGQRVSLTALVDGLMGGLVTLPAEVPNLPMTAFSLAVTPKTGVFSVSAEAMDPWEIPVGFDDLQLDDLTLTIERTVDDAGKKSLSGAIGGTLAIAGASFRSDYSFPGEFVLTAQVPSLKLSPVVQDLCGTTVLQTLPIPTSVLAIEFNDVSVTVAPQSRYFSLEANSPLGLVEMMVKKAGTSWAFVVGFLPPTSWKFSSIDSSLRVLDGLAFNDTALILSSVDDRSLALTSLSPANAELTVIRGLNFVANLGMQGLGVDALLGIDNLRIYTAIGGNPADIVLEAQIDGMFTLADGVAFGDIKFRLQPSPSNFSLTLLGTVTAILDNSALAFVGGMQVQPRSAIFQASMLGIWNEPFGTKGLAIANVALDLGVSFPPPLPTVGLAGTLQVGDFAGAVAVKFDSAMPSRSMLAVAFNQLYLMDVISTFCGASVARAIPASLASTVLNIGFEDVNIYVVPQPTSIGELTFEQGFYLAGTLLFWGLRATASLSIDYLEGTELKAEVDPINVANIFKLSGAGGRPKPSLYFKLSPNPSQTPTVEISGVVELLGLRSETQLSFNDQGFYFFSTGKIFDLFEASLEVKGQDLKSGGSIWVKATMRNDLTAYLHREATAAIEAAATAATRDLTAAQAEVAKAQDTVNKLNTDINNMRATIQRERDRDTENLRKAQAEVGKAQDTVNKLNTDINNTRATIQRERDRDTENLRKAQAEVSKAQATVDQLQQEINGTKNRISQLERDIRDKKSWYDRSSTFQKSWRWAEYSAYAAAKGTEIGALYTKIGGIEAARGTANGVLELAKQTLRGIEAGAKTFPIDADPRIVGLFTARETANGTLELAKLSLRGMEEAAKTIPIDADPRIVGLFTARETATGALTAAHYTLEGVKKTVGAMAEVSQFIVDVGLGGILDIRSAEFEGSLAATQGGSVTMVLGVVFMRGQLQTLSLAFSFTSPQQAALELAQRLLP